MGREYILTLLLRFRVQCNESEYFSNNGFKNELEVLLKLASF